jgi:hypothetical protein
MSLNNKLRISLFREDGYINVTKLCKAGNKQFRHWNAINKTRSFLKILQDELKGEILIKFQTGYGATQGTWAHPYVAINIAQWISPLFSVYVSKWILEWKDIKKENSLKFQSVIESIDDSYNTNQREKEVVAFLLENTINASVEVKTEYGYIDILTEFEIIEVKLASKWKHAIGQIIVYSQEYPEHKKRIHLFDVDTSICIKSIKKVCDSLGIILTF